ncbi:MAG: T9SS C-terminal target domain-containing protein [Bacteroidetes bacterium]|nr:MAG: T9SS C-terminal target domain-containing protein [Bacteroidota bacterium]
MRGQLPRLKITFIIAKAIFMTCSRNFLCAVLTIFCQQMAMAQLPTSICSPSGGKRADIISVATAYRAPGGLAPTFAIPPNATTALVTVSSHSSVVTSPSVGVNLGDEDFITISAVVSLPTASSSGFLNYAQNTFINASGTNVYSWINLPANTNASTQISVGQSSPTLLNDVRFSVSGSTLTITEASSVIHSTYMVEFTRSTTNSLLENGFARAVMSSALASTSTPIPAGTNLIVISNKGTINKTNYITAGGTSEGYSDSRFVIDLDAGLTNGFVTVSNGANAAFRSTYRLANHPATSTTPFLSSGNAFGDLASKSTTSSASTSDIGISNPAIYVSGSNLVIDRDLAYRTDFDDVYVIEFYRRTGLGMSVEFIETQSRFIPVGQGTFNGTGSVLNIPGGAEYIILRQAGNANNQDSVNNENSLAAYVVIDLKNEQASGYFYQQVGFQNAAASPTPANSIRRDDNYAFRNLPLNGTSSRDPIYSGGFYSIPAANPTTPYDLRFTLSANKSQLTVTNAFGLVPLQYQLLTNADFFGSRPDYAFTTNVSSDITYANNGFCGQVAITARLCNPGSGNSSGGVPISFYSKNPTTDGTARLLAISPHGTPLPQGTCSDFVFNLDLKALSIANPNIEIFAIANDNGSFVAGGVGSTVGTPFALASLSTQTSQFRECDYTNNLVNFTITGVMPCSNGIVRRDPNGLTNNQIDGTPIGNPSSQQLYVNVLDASNIVRFVSPVNVATGAFDAQPNGPGNFVFQLSTTQGTVGAAAPAKTLPPRWVNVGENSTTGSGSDMLSNGLLPVTGLTTSSILSTLLGIQQVPNTTNHIGEGFVNPGGSLTVNVPTPSFKASDPEDGTYTLNLMGRKVTIFPAVGGGVYYDGTLITTATTIPVFDNNLVDVDPAALGSTSMSFQFAVWDNADFQDPTPATISLGFNGVILPATGFVARGYFNNNVPVVAFTTLTEINTRQFVIERSAHGVAFKAIGYLQAAGNSQQRRKYFFEDNAGYSGLSYYRVRLDDMDGKKSYSNTVMLNSKIAVPPAVQLWPNPAQKTVSLSIHQKGSFQVLIYNSVGVLTVSKQIKANAPGATTTIERNSLPAGTYLVKVIDTNTLLSTTQKITFN